MKFLVPNYSCLQNSLLGGYHPQISVLSVLNLICWTPPRKKIPGYATVYQHNKTFLNGVGHGNKFSSCSFSGKQEASSAQHPFYWYQKVHSVAGDWLAGWHVPLLALYDLDSSPVTTETVNCAVPLKHDYQHYSSAALSPGRRLTRTGIYYCFARLEVKYIRNRAE